MKEDKGGGKTMSKCRPIMYIENFINVYVCTKTWQFNQYRPISRSQTFFWGILVWGLVMLKTLMKNEVHLFHQLELKVLKGQAEEKLFFY